MEFYVLGPLRVQSGGKEIAVPTAFKPRLVLAILLAHSGHLVPAESLVDAVWAGRPPSSARRIVHQYVHHLRSALGADRIVSSAGGYSIIAGEDGDAQQFRRSAAAGHAALRNGDAESARAALRTALDLWRGQAYSGFVDCDLIAQEAMRLERLRLETHEWWVQAQLATRQYLAAVADLEELVRANPYRESLYQYLMIALYGLDRRAESLEAFQTVRAKLADELGIEPGPGLRRLHEAILRGEDAELMPGATDVSIRVARAPEGATAPFDAPRELPAEGGLLVGRHDALKALDEVLQAQSGVDVVAVTGTAGVGKTALAVCWAHRVADHFPDGQLFIDLRGYATDRPLRPIEALTLLAIRLGVPAARLPVDLPSAEAVYRSATAHRRLLILLDNARSSAQVRPLLPSGRGSAVVVTSRDRLSGLVARDGAQRIALDVLRSEDSVGLLGRLVGRERVTAEPAATDELAAACAHLPLALRIAGAELADGPYATVSAYLVRLREAGPLTALAVEDDDVAVRAAFDLSYRTLDELTQRVFRRLGLVPCLDFTANAAAALAGVGVPEARRALDALAAAHLVNQPTPGRFTLHDLLRQFAGGLCANADSRTERDAAVYRLLEYQLATVSAAGRVLQPEVRRLPDAERLGAAIAGPDSYQAALDWMDAERLNLVQSVRYSARHGPWHMAWLLADGMRGYLHLRLHVADWLACARAALAAARVADDPSGQATAFHGLAHVHFGLGHPRRAMAYLSRAIDLYGRLGDLHRQATLLSNLGMLLNDLGRPDEAIERLTEAATAQRRLGSTDGHAGVMLNLANTLRARGRLEEALDCATVCLNQYQSMDTNQLAPIWVALAIGTMGEVLQELGRYDEAIEKCTDALSRHEMAGNYLGRFQIVVALAHMFADTGRLDEARRYGETALRMGSEDKDPSVKVRAWTARAAACRASGDQDEAIRLYKLALDVATDPDLAPFVVDVLLGLAAAHHRNGDPERAIGSGEQALALARHTGRRVREAQALTVLANAYLVRGDHARAIDLGSEALTLHQMTGHRPGEAATREVIDLATRSLGSRI